MLPVTPLPYEAHYTVLTAVNTSGAASGPSTETAATPLKVDGPDLTAGSVTAAAIQAGAVTAEKLEAILQLVTRIVAGDPDGARVELNEDGLRVYNSADQLVIQFNSADGSAVFTGDITGSDITGSTVTGSTVTGSLIQTATTGERITINEDDDNKIFIYNADGEVVAAITTGGISLTGPNGNVMAISPATTLPSFRWFNTATTKSARIQAAETASGAVRLETLSSRFTSGGFNDWVWHQIMGEDTAFIERIRDDGTFSTWQGGALYLQPTYTKLSFNNTIDPTQGCNLTIEPSLAYFQSARLQVLPPASANSALYVEGLTAHTGYLFRIYRDSDRFLVDKDGNTTIAGSVTAINQDQGTVNAVMSAVSSVDVTVTFNKTFPTTPRVVASLRGNPTLPAGSSALIVRPFNITTTGCSVRVNDVGGVARTLTHAVDWIARST
jgi:hypothetical protein